MMNNGAALFLGILLSVAASFWTLLFAPQLQIGRQQVRPLESGELYPAPRPGLAQRGAEIYRSLGCAECHTRQVRQTGAIFEVHVAEVGTNTNAVVAVFGQTAMTYDDEGLDARHFRKLPATVGTNLAPKAALKLVTQFTAAGAKAVPVLIPLGPDMQRGWGARLSVAQDYLHDYPVLLGNLRLGPDLANFGARQTNLEDIHTQLYDSPRLTMGSLMPPYRFLYELRPLTNGAALPPEAILLTAADANSPAQVIIPSEDAVALAAYLTSLKAEALLFEAPRPKPASPAPPPTNAPPATNVTAAARLHEPERRAPARREPSAESRRGRYLFSSGRPSAHGVPALTGSATEITLRPDGSSRTRDRLKPGLHASSAAGTPDTYRAGTRRSVPTVQRVPTGFMASMRDLPIREASSK